MKDRINRCIEKSVLTMATKTVILAVCLVCLAILSVAEVAAFQFSGETIAPPFFNKVETSSTTNLKIASLTTELGNRFIIGGSKGGIEIHNNVQVSSYSYAVPSKGSVSAFIKGTIMEGSNATASYGLQPQIYSSYPNGKQIALEGMDNNVEKSSGLVMTLEFYNSHSMSGDIISFSKSMSYNSVLSGS